jgi:hypothetical protein
MGNAILYRMAAGIQGAVSCEENKTIESVPLGSTAFPTYGVPGKLSAGTIIPIGAADTAGLVYGLLIRPFPTTNGPSGSALGAQVPPTTGIGNVLRRGYATVKCNNGTPAKGGQVYVRIDTPSGAKVVGGLEATSDGAHTIAPAGWFFNGPADADGNVEIQVNI